MLDLIHPEKYFDKHEVHSATDAAAQHFQHVGVLTALFQFYPESEQFIKSYLLK